MAYYLDNEEPLDSGSVLVPPGKAAAVVIHGERFALSLSEDGFTSIGIDNGVATISLSAASGAIGTGTLLPPFQTPTGRIAIFAVIRSFKGGMGTGYAVDYVAYRA